MNETEQLPPFTRQDRYTVLKNTDISKLPVDLRNDLMEVLAKVSSEMPTRKYVVVESDWPEYEPVWEMISQRWSKERAISLGLLKITRFKVMLMNLTKNVKTEKDLLLVSLFIEYENPLEQLFESCIPDTQPWMKWDPKKCTRAEIHGPMFHKSFRQTDVVNGKVDSAIWDMLNGPTAFWEAHHESMQDYALAKAYSELTTPQELKK